MNNPHKYRPVVPRRPEEFIGALTSLDQVAPEYQDHFKALAHQLNEAYVRHMLRDDDKAEDELTEDEKAALAAL